MNNTVLDAIRNRRSCREFQGKKVDDDLMRAILDAGRWHLRVKAFSHGNL